MIEVLAGAGAALAVCLAPIVWLTYKLVGAKDEQLAARDLLDKEREEKRAIEGELATEAAAHAVTRDELAKEKNLRASTESERNDAYRKERENVVAIIEQANLADAAGIVARILAAPLPGVVQAVPEGRATAPGPDRLIDPEL